MFSQSDDDFQLSNYDYQLPSELIAYRPITNRNQAKLLVYKEKSQQIEHRLIRDLPSLLPQDHALVFNNSKVLPCRFIGKKSTGGRCEVFLLSFAAEIYQDNLMAFPAMLNTSGKKQKGETYFLGPHHEILATLLGPWNEKGTGVFAIQFVMQKSQIMPNHLDLLNLGQIPLPPYIREGIGDEQDKIDYQTIYACEPGSVAAPTAGLHFTPSLLSQLKIQGHPLIYVTLHVGPGTFRPVKSDDIRDHQMHSETFFVTKENQILLNENKNKLIAVGTTSLRVLESLDENKTCGQTQLFLYPGKKIQSIRGLLTNFHLPKSSLLMLVSALIGRKKTLELYDLAKENHYRFYSYGDAMCILRDS